MFTSYPTYLKRRPLKLSTPHLQGEDVYALQTALIECGFSLPKFGADGDLGKETADAIVEAQRHFKIEDDGIAGGTTQRVLAIEIATKVRAKYSIAIGALYGQLSLESGFWLGIYSPLRPDGSYDAGVAQRNTRLTPPEEGFDCRLSVDALGARLREYFDLFEGLPLRRRWELAQASWNAPAFASYIAREEGSSVPDRYCSKTLSDDARAKLEAYIDAASAYLRV